MSKTRRRKHQQALARLSLSSRARKVCKALGLKTVQDLHARTREELLTVPGCGERTCDELIQAASRAGAKARKTTVAPVPTSAKVKVTATKVTPAKIKVTVAKIMPTEADTKPTSGGTKLTAGEILPTLPEGLGGVALLELLNHPRAQRAFVTVGITTVAEFLETPKDRLLAVRGFGEGSYRQLMEKLECLASHRRQDMGLLPGPLLQFPLAEVGFSRSVLPLLEGLGMATMGDVLAWPPDFWAPGFPGARAAGEIREGLDRLVRVGLEQVVPATAADADTSLTDMLLQALPNNFRDHLRRRLGLGVPAALLSELAESTEKDPRKLLEIEREIRRTLQERGAGPLCRLRDELYGELQAFEGVVVGDHLAPGTLAHAVARDTGYPLLPLRIVAFCFPTDFHLHQGCLLSLPSATFRRFLARLRELTGPGELPVRLTELTADLSSIVDPVPQGLLRHVLENVCKLTLFFTDRDGEFVTRRADSVAGRLHRLLAESGEPTALLDLVFTYRDRHRHARKDRLLNHLRRDKTFLEVEREVWALREGYQDQLDMTFTEADRAAQAIASLGGRHDVRSVMRGDSSEREIYMVIDCLRRDPRVRYLGRGEFCPASSSRSVVLKDLARDFRRAMGEVPMARFIANSPADRRRLAASLLRQNRLFVEPGPDRVDLLTNYPYDDGRMRKTLSVVRQTLARRRGYASVEALVQDLDEAGLGGMWLNGHMLTDLLRRHGRFELLPGGLVAKTSLGLGDWIQVRAREAIRVAGIPLTTDGITAEVPELAEFADALEQMLGQDPLLHTADGMYFSAV